jgi:hypothetical protein
MRRIIFSSLGNVLFGNVLFGNVLFGNVLFGGVLFGSVLFGSVLLVASSCVEAGKPLTEEDRCVILCEGNGNGHPCQGEEPATDCVSTCAAHITPLVDDCLTCVLTQSGWIGQSCECTDVDPFGMVDVQCDACSYTTHDRDCASSPQCTRDTATCEGFTLVKTTDAICAPACGQ